MEKNFVELCYACRIGDTDNVDRLISTGVNLNDVDQFDNSPLFLASLCGHEDVVKLLLKRGAVCDRDRYEGARCIYGALTDSIRDVLLRYDISKAVDVNQPFTMHISSLIKGDYFIDAHDLCFNSTETIPSSNNLKLHKFILSSRSSVFKRILSTRWNGKHTINLPTGISSREMNTIIKFIYLVPVLHEIDQKEYDPLIDFSIRWDMPILAEFLEKARHIYDPTEKSTLMAEYQYKFIELAREQLCDFVNEGILKNTINLPKGEGLKRENILSMGQSAVFPDLILILENSEKQKRAVPCHLAVLSRAYYFKLMFALPLSESSVYARNRHCQNSDNLSALVVVKFPRCEFEIAIIILRYLYYDSSDIPWQHAVDVLLVADILLEDRLKSMAAVVITQSKEVLKHYSIFDILCVSWETRMERIEHFVARVIAQNIRTYAKDPALKNAVLQSSRRISAREETDTIELIDDIRFYLLEKYAFEPDDIEFLSNEEDMSILKNSGILEYQQDIEVIEDLLDALDLQA